MDQHKLIDVAIAATDKGVQFQTSLREYINQELKGYDENAVAHAVAEFVSQYRTRINDWVKADPSEYKDRQKKVNNICNDISRMSRELLGHSIVCKGKKGGEYTYVPKVPAVRTLPAIEVLAPSLPSVSEPTYEEMQLLLKSHEVYIKELECILQENNQTISNLMNRVKDKPGPLLEEMVQVHGTEYTGMLMIQVLNNSD